MKLVIVVRTAWPVGYSAVVDFENGTITSASGSTIIEAIRKALRAAFPRKESP